MEKSILALVVATALTAPLVAQADTILYGSARVSVDYVDEESGAVEDLLNNDGYWDITNNSSRLGVLGEEELGGGLSAIYQYEFGVDVTEGGNFESNRPKLVGLKGGFGQISAGTQETPYYHIVGIADTFNSGRSFGPTAWLGGAFASDSVRGPGDLVRFDNSLYYATPDLNGFGVEAMLVADGSLNDNQGFSDDIDFWNLAAKYSNGPFFAGVSYIKLNGDSNVLVTLDNGSTLLADLDLEQWALGLGYNSGPFSLALIYEQGDLNSPNLARKIRFTNGIPLATGDDAKNYYLTGSYAFGNNTLRAAYGQLDSGIDGEDTIDNYLVGYQYNFSKRTSLWVEYIGRSADTLLYGDQNAVSIGTRVDF
ncbi:MAG: porin [Candidatus Competibacteraceae bacterium]|nr:porin [Candidatus Competibacteraceae bacterium]